MPFFLKAEPGTTPKNLSEMVALRMARVRCSSSITWPWRYFSARMSSKSATALDQLLAVRRRLGQHAGGYRGRLRLQAERILGVVEHVRDHVDQVHHAREVLLGPDGQE